MTISYILILLLTLMSGSGCRTVKTEYVPVQTIKTEYRDKLVRDSVYILDSVFSYSKNDTVFRNKYRYFTKSHYLKDTVNVKDIIRVPYPVEKVMEVNRLKWWQEACVYFTGIVILLLLIYSGFKYKANIISFFGKLFFKI